MTVDCNLQVQLDQAAPDDLFDVILILKHSAILSKSGPVDPSNIAAGRKTFAKHASKMLTDVIKDASRKSGKSYTDLTIFDHMASAQLCAPVKLVEQLAAHPFVASIKLWGQSQVPESKRFPGS